MVQPLTVDWLRETTDLLTDVFATLGGPGWGAYRRFMRKQIRGFLEVSTSRSTHDSVCPRAGTAMSTHTRAR